MCVRACVCVCARARACVRASVRACVCVRVRVCVYLCVRARVVLFFLFPLPQAVSLKFSFKNHSPVIMQM